MKKALFALFLCFLVHIGFGGCPGPKISTSTGISSGHNYFAWYSIYESPADSFQLTMTHNMCYLDHNSTVSFNGQIIHVSKSGFTIRLPRVYGRYTITASLCKWDIYIETKPKTPATASTVSQNTSVSTLSTSALPAEKIPNPDFLFYPNPAHDEITLCNESDEIRSIAFYTTEGLLFSKYEIQGPKIILPLNNYPTGIYFMHVATLTGRTMIKKIAVL